MKIRIKKKGVEVEFEYKAKWWGSEFDWTELLRVLPFIERVLGLKPHYFSDKRR